MKKKRKRKKWPYIEGHVSDTQAMYKLDPLTFIANYEAENAAKLSKADRWGKYRSNAGLN